MKKLLFAISLLVCCATTLAQETISYHDWLGRPCDKGKASMIYVLSKTDSSWCKKLYFLPDLQIGSIYNYKDSACSMLQGSFQQFYTNGKLKQSGSYQNGNLSGIWMRYYQNGSIQEYANHSGGLYNGPLLSWHSNGVLSDSTAFNLKDSTLVTVGWFNDGMPSYAGKYKKGYMEGKWKFYHITGHLSAEEWYKDGKLINKKYYDEDGVPEKDTTSKDRDAVYKKGINKWAKYIERKIDFPAQYQTANKNSFTIKVFFTLNEEGQVINIDTLWPVHPDFNKALLEVMKRSPKWQPAIRNNRRIRNCFYHNFTFTY